MSSAEPPSIESLLAHRTWLRRLARSLVRDAHEADDLEQEVWVKALRRPPRTGRSVRGWLATVLRNAARDRRRVATRRAAHEARAHGRPTSPSAERLMQEAELQRRIAQATLDLAPHYRDTVLLRHFGALSLREIAEQRDVPLETVRTRLRRAHAQLRARLDAEHEGGRRGWLGVLLPLASGPAPATTGTVAAPLAVIGGVVVSTKVVVTTLVLALVAVGLFMIPRGDDEAPPTSLLAESHEATSPGGSTHGNENPQLDGAARASPSSGAEAPSVRAATRKGAAVYKGTPPFKPGPGRIVGVITDARGKPVVNARVFIEVMVDGRATNMPPRSRWLMNTGARGGFWFGALTAPRYRIRVEASGFADTFVTAAAGSEPMHLALEDSAPIKGIVFVGDDKEPVGGLLLIARSAKSSSDRAYWTVRTKADGTFAFDRLAPGEYFLSYGPAWQTDVEAPGNDLVMARVGPVVAGGESLVIEAVRGLPIAGRIQTSDGEPVTTPILVEAVGWLAPGEEDPARRRSASSRKDGTFRIGGLPPGRYTVAFKPNLANDATSALSAAPLTGIAAGTLDLVGELSKGTPLRGRLVDDEGAAVTGDGFVYVYPAGSDAASPQAVFLRVDREGRFQVGALAAGTAYTILATGFGDFRTKELEGVYPGDQEIEVELTSGPAISGRVLDEYGQPVPAGVGVNAHAQGDVDHSKPGTGKTGYTGPGGRFRIAGLSADCVFRLQAGGGETVFIGGETVADIKPGAADVVLRVKRGTRIQGRLIDRNGTPVKTGYLAAHGTGSPGVANHTRVDREDGRFVFAGGPHGKFTLVVRLGDEFVLLGTYERSEEELVVTVPRP